MADIIYDGAKADELIKKVNKADWAVKQAASAAEGLAISLVVHKITKRIIPKDAPWWEKLAVWGASFAVGGVVSSLNTKRLQDEHDEVTKMLGKLKSSLDEAFIPEPEVEVIIDEQP